MIHIIIYDDIHLSDLKNLEDYDDNKLYALEVSVNAHSDVMDNNRDRALHRLLRFNEFCCFDKNVRLIINSVDELYLKYGGLCFLWFNDIDRYKKVEKNIKYLFKFEYKVDEFNSNLLLDRSNTAAAIDKTILRKAFLEKNSDIIYYRPTKELLGMPKDKVMSIISEMTCKDIMKSPYFNNIKTSKNPF